MQDESTFNKEQPYMLPPSKFKSLQSIMQNSDIRLRQTSFKIDQGGIVDHYQKIRQQQHQALAFINMPHQRKRTLFGIYKPPQGDGQQETVPLVIEDHPRRGKVVMTKETWQARQYSREKQNQFNQSGLSQIKRNPNGDQFNRDEPIITTEGGYVTPEEINNNLTSNNRVVIFSNQSPISNWAVNGIKGIEEVQSKQENRKT